MNNLFNAKELKAIRNITIVFIGLSTIYAILPNNPFTSTRAMVIRKFNSNTKTFVDIGEYAKTDPNESSFFAGNNKFTWLLPRSEFDIQTQWVKGLNQGEESRFRDDLKFVLFHLGFQRVMKQGDRIYFFHNTYQSKYVQGVFYSTGGIVQTTDSIKSYIINTIPIGNNWTYFYGFDPFYSELP